MFVYGLGLGLKLFSFGLDIPNNSMMINNSGVVMSDAASVYYTISDIF